MLKIEMKSKDVTVDKSFDKTGKLLGQQGDIRASRMEITIIYKDIDEISAKEEVGEALG